VKLHVALVMALMATTAAAEPSARLTRIQDMNEQGEMNPDATVGQTVVGYYIELQSKHPNSLAAMNDNFTCKSGPSQILKAIASKHARSLPADLRTKFAAKDDAALDFLAVDVIAELDSTDAATIWADEALGPGVYRPAIDSIAYTIGRCRFYR